MKNWIERTFKLITTNRAKEINLKFVRNIFGDEINMANCRSIWENSKGQTYRVRELKL